MENPLSLEETLLPALFECFGIMLLGYILGKFEVLGKNEARGISKFVQYLALPALIFVRISTMSFNNVKWEFIAAVFVTKALIFVCVILMTILLTHPPHLGKSGIYAIASTQSNDFALAYPMFISLYKNNHVEYPSYLYIVAPIQLVVLNTIGFFIIETQKQQHDTKNFHILRIIKETIKNPVVFMTIIGIICNVSFGNTILPILNTLLQTLSSAFPATALLLVGHTMAIKDRNSDNHISITVALLILTKNLIMPIVLQKFSALMLQGSNHYEIQSLSSFGFLYGTVPTAPSTYVFAVQYDVAVDVITKTIIGSTLLSAPLIYASASGISISQMGIENTSFYLNLTMRYLSCASLLCCSWLLFSFIIGKRFRNISFGVTLYIFFAQFLTSIGGILLFFTQSDHSTIFYAQYILSTGGIYATRICTLFLAVLLFVIRWRSLCYIIQMKKYINVISVLCVFVPFIIAALALTFSNIKSEGPDCQLGYIQTILTFTITIICLIGIVLCLILQHICFRKKSSDETKSYVTSYQEIGESERISPKITDVKKLPTRCLSDDEISIDVEDLGKCFEDLLSDSENLLTGDIQNDLCDTRYNCSSERRLQCTNYISSYRNEQREIGLYDDKEIFQHTIVLIVLSVSMTLNLTVCFWKLIEEEVDGIFIELEFLDIIIKYGFGILLFIIFGFDKELVNIISTKWKMLRYSDKRNITGISNADICNEFITKHKKKFIINRNINRNKLKTSHCSKFANAFSRADFSEWLVQNGVISDNNEADSYILKLEEAQIIQKIDDCRSFSENEGFIFTDECD